MQPWDENTIVMKEKHDEESLDNLYHSQFQQSEHLKPLLSLYIQDTAQQDELRDYTDFEKLWSGISTETS